MSQISAINATVARDQFLQLLVAQLQNQDPLNPVSDTEFISQLSQLSQLESLQNLDANFSQVLRLQQLTSGTSLVGKTVTFTDEQGSTQTGTVSAVAVNNGNFELTIGAAQVPLDKVTSAR
ncbi:MAG: flagellar hook capping protein [Fimbriiglobus sp.]|jgi:flagellar basal-body rod modification protein FlgD|nr:flagellar hook capping protein [Fimbriiglobus sp.]